MSIDEDNKVSEEQIDAAERRKQAAEFKDKGNSYVKSKDYEAAIKMYSRAIELCNDDPIYYSNRSQCYLSSEKYQECIDDASKAIELDPKSSKSFYRRMVAYEKLEDDYKALQNCRQLLDLTPEDQTSKNSYDRIHNRIMEAQKKKDKEKIRWSRLGSNAEVSNFVTKPPHLSSKRPMKNIPIRVRKVASPIPEAVLDKIFDNNTGETTPEPVKDSKLFKPNFLIASPPKIAKLEEKPKNESPIIEDKKAVDEANETLKANEIKKDQHLTSEELETHKNSYIVLPLSGPQFFTAWKELSDIQRFLYLKNIAEANAPIGKLLGAQLNSEILSEIIFIIHKYFLNNDVPLIRLLRDLGENSQVKVLAMFLDDDEKKSEFKVKWLLRVKLII